MRHRPTRSLFSAPLWFGLCALLFPALVIPAQSAPVSVLTQHNDNQRTGANLSETALTTANVNVNAFGKLFSCPVDGFVYAQPLYAPGVHIASGTYNVLYVATAHDSVFAFDADTGATLKTRSLGIPVPSSVINTPNIQVEVGIISTPVIDQTAGVLYVVAKTYAGNTQQFWLHALDMTTLQDKQTPVQISAQVSGTGYGPNNLGDNDGRHVFFVASQENQRAALTLVNGTLYIAFASHEDYDDYHGWVLAYTASTLAQAAVYNATPNGKRGGIWMSGQGLVADAADNVYLLTGNSTNDSENNAGDYGEAFVKLVLSNNTLTVGDYFKAGNYDGLNAGDVDLGSGGAMMIPGTNDLVGGGKQGLLYVVNTADMGQLNTASDHVVQEWQADNGLWGTPVFWNGALPTLYVWGQGDTLNAYPFANGLFAVTPSSRSGVFTPYGDGSGALAVSANGSTAGSGIVWATVPQSDPDHNTVPGTLYAFDAANVATELWDSRKNAGRDDYGNFAKFCSPTVVNGKVYVPTDSGRVAVYGLLSGGGTQTPPELLSGNVTFAGGRPASGSAPSANPAGNGALVVFTSASGATVTATPDANGNYSIETPQGVYTGIATAASPAGSSPPAGILVGGSGAAANFVIALNPGTITGQVTYKGKGYQGATVSFTATPNPAGGAAPTAITDAGGNYTSPGLPAGAYTITAAANGELALNNAQGQAQAGTTSPASVPIVLQDPALVPLTGTVSSAATTFTASGPIHGATITVKDLSGNPVSTTPSPLSTSSAGAYAGKIHQGTYTVTASATGYYSSSQQVVMGVTATQGTANFTLTKLPTIATGSLSGHYNLISWPDEDSALSGDASAFTDVFGPVRSLADPNGNRSLAANWQSKMGRYVFESSSPADGMHLGYGYFVYLYNAPSVYSVSGTPPAGPTVTVPLQGGVGLDGWNMIGVPSMTPISVSRLQVRFTSGTTVSLGVAAGTNDAIGATLYGYDPNANAYKPVTMGQQLQPFQGYWIRARVSGLSLVIPTGGG